MEKASVFLKTEQAVRAICLDFGQYDPQVMLFCEIIRLISRDTLHLKRGPGKSGAWITRPNQAKMRWLDGLELVKFMCDAVTRTIWDPELLANVCGRVFQTRAVPETDRQTGAEGVRIETNMETYECRQCGNCCRSLNYHDEVTSKDVERWKDLGRNDILKWVQVSTGRGRPERYRIWVSPKTGCVADICPFLAKDPTRSRWHCRIHEVKPAICRQYPVSRKHALETGCRGFDKRRASKR